MNLPTPDPRSPLDDRWLDRLADGELDGPARRALIDRLEAEPDGWRRCALAFLEHQCWRESLSTPAPPGVAAPPPRPIRDRRAPLLAAAALAMAAFALGLAAGRRLPQDVRSDAPTLARSPVPAPPPVADPAPVRAVGLLHLDGGGPGGPPTGRGVQVPVLAGPGLDEGWLRRRPPAVTDDEIRSLEDAGYLVERNRMVYSLSLDEGRTLNVPVDEVTLQYVGRPTD